MNTRELTAIVQARPSTDGDGVKIQRVAGRDVQSHFDPFLLLDEISSDKSEDYIGGFPPHPHRGFETITYMVKGKFRHEDHLGNQGHLSDGGVQWMRAGRGVVHAEIPEQSEGELLGFQLWLNLPAVEKMQPPHYQDFSSEMLPVIRDDQGNSIKVLAGEWQGHASPLLTGNTAAIYLDVTLAKGQSLTFDLPESHQVAAYVYEGGTDQLACREMGFYTVANVDGNGSLVLNSQQGARLLLLAGRPIREPIAQHGPFVMNTQQEIEQAIEDYNNGTLTAA